MAENSASRTRSVVGRVTSPRGTIRRRPPAEPAMTLTFARRRRGWKGLRFPASRPVQPGSGRLHLNPGDGVVQRRIGQLGVLGHASLGKFSGLRDEVGIGHYTEQSKTGSGTLPLRAAHPASWTLMPL